ncbi:capsular polysaccharide biosynthesis protein [Nitrococcus mobilis]|uniref:Capsule polysaccharide modification protein n=1 Tax=Nitrococcus mobilis Nb-231 TaxID=314278 RepID=A4BRR6_9GAMM|nr:capsular polysaccharide biosynthesis protein [Nitrococcus mobilis]EAR21637.1 capsule polysaccharide modification protein [Nitrococcus mobilis Nb-231]
MCSTHRRGFGRGEDASGLRVGVFSRGIRRIPHIKALLRARAVILNPGAGDAATLDAVAGWGRRRLAVRAERYAASHGLPLLRLEDGFLRSLGLAVKGARPLSLIVDDLGIYYDTTRPSRLTELLNGPPPDHPDPLQDPALLDRAAYCMRRIAEAKLSKYNHAPDAPERLGRTSLRKQVLVVDQTAGDRSVTSGQADAATFARMLAAAIHENPHAEILVKTHPDVLAGKRRGYLDDVPEHPRVTLLRQDMNARSLLDRVDRVYTVTSQLGLEAVVAGKPVTVFGVPCYSGWGLTDDRAPTPHARRPRSVAELFAAAYLLYPRYLDPVTGELCAAETVIDHLALQRHWFSRNSGRLFCVGFRRWKRSFVRIFLASPGNKIHFVRSAVQARGHGFDRGSRLIVWGHREGDDIRALAEEAGVPIERMEDGFIRSLGLGSDMTAPLSLVLDRSGLYYDPTGASDLEHILATAECGEDLRRRARALRERLIALGISKYNFSDQGRVSLPLNKGKTVILVPGQVEDDTSVRLGCPGLRTNRCLLEAVRAARPEAYILYKPHPEVLSGNRRGCVAQAPGERLWDELVTNVSVASCLAAVDEVHTLTSLVGFEALLRGRRVVTYGRPFYSGWGLTEDVFPLARRRSHRRLMLDELVAGALILYPRYIDPITETFTTPEVALERLAATLNNKSGTRRLSQPWVVRQLHKLGRRIAGVNYAGQGAAATGARRAFLQLARRGAEIGRA